MLSKTHRLTKNSDIQRAFRTGRSFFNPFFSLKYLKGKPSSRFTVVVSVKVSKRAVVRNRIKRLVREFIRLNMDSFPTGDYVVTAKPALASKIEEIPLILKQLFTRGKLLV